MQHRTRSKTTPLTMSTQRTQILIFTKGNQDPLEKSLIPELGQGMYDMSLANLTIAKSKRVLKGWRVISKWYEIDQGGEKEVSVFGNLCSWNSYYTEFDFLYFLLKYLKIEESIAFILQLFYLPYLIILVVKLFALF